jgi:ATP adenylyltransferase
MTDRLWAPWRLAYVGSPKSDGCIFCHKPTAGDDCANYLVFRGESAFVMLNAFPYNNGHLMVAPYAHESQLESLPLSTLNEMMSLCQQGIGALKRVMNPDGFNVGFNLGAAAGAGIKDHLHMHVVPRWNGDTNFMPVLADVRVIPQSLDESWHLLSEAFRELSGGAA